jgi:hypothetical protein
MNSVSVSTKRPLQGALTLIELLAGVVLVYCLTEQPAKAYADPGSGAVLWQLFFASLVSVGFHFRKLRVWLSALWSRRRPTA